MGCAINGDVVTVGVRDFKAEVDKVIRECKNTPAAPGYVGVNGETVVLVPGEPERITEKENRKRGIEVPDPQWKTILETAEKLGVEISLQ